MVAIAGLLRTCAPVCHRLAPLLSFEEHQEFHEIPRQIDALYNRLRELYALATLREKRGRSSLFDQLMKE